MISIPWDIMRGWGAPTIIPYGPLQLDPSVTVLHYAQTLFEGMKAYRDENGKVTLFRPDMNMKRMNRSAQRIALPTFNGEALLEIIKTLVKLDSHWIPKEPGHSLYIRPTLIGTQRALGVAPPNEALLFVICSPVGPYYKNGFKPVRLLATTEYIRASPRGTGGYKLGANYAPGVVPQVEAAVKGYDQILWLLGEEDYLTEVGTMNLFIALKNKDGKTELVTPPLEDLILPGVTRDSILCLARDHVSGKIDIPGLPKDLVVSERHITMGEIKAAADSGNLLEVFGAGTAAIVCPVKEIGYKGKDIKIPVGKEGMGPMCKGILDQIVARQMGTIPSEWSVVVTEGTKGSMHGPKPVA
ncbi:amino-transferase class IV protein [Ceratobasidium sp. AG-Ba]|nr:amino-transferase class IV protein [Ceratobasidium sp. AG-Ba]